MIATPTHVEKYSSMAVALGHHMNASDVEVHGLTLVDPVGVLRNNEFMRLHIHICGHWNFYIIPFACKNACRSSQASTSRSCSGHFDAVHMHQMFSAPARYVC